MRSLIQYKFPNLNYLNLGTNNIDIKAAKYISKFSMPNLK